MKKIPDDQLTHDQKVKQKQRAEFYIKHKERLKREANERYRKMKAENPEKLIGAARRWRENNREKYNEYHQKYRNQLNSPQMEAEFASHRKRVVKTISKRVESSVAAAELQSQRISLAKLGQQKVLESGRTPFTTKTLKEYVQSVKAGRPCLDCGGVFPPFVLDFDHRDPSDKKKDPRAKCSYPTAFSSLRMWTPKSPNAISFVQIAIASAPTPVANLRRPRSSARRTQS